MISWEQYKTDFVGVNRFIDQETGKVFVDMMTREQYYKLYMNGLSLAHAYDHLKQLQTGDSIGNTLAWSTHYSREFNESPYLKTNIALQPMIKYLGFVFQ
jgi:hypothetical protein